jgi:hypothetical protein
VLVVVVLVVSGKGVEETHQNQVCCWCVLVVVVVIRVDEHVVEPGVHRQTPAHSATRVGTVLCS